MRESGVERSGATSPSATRIATTSQDECSAWLEAAGFTGRHDQVARGRYAAEFELVTLSPDLRFSRSAYSTAVTTHGAPPRGVYAFAVPASDPAGLYFNQCAVGDGEIALV